MDITPGTNTKITQKKRQPLTKITKKKRQPEIEKSKTKAQETSSKSQESQANVSTKIAKVTHNLEVYWHLKTGTVVCILVFQSSVNTDCSSDLYSLLS